MAYDIINSRGTTIATIGVATTTGATFPIELLGEGISPYGTQIATTQYYLLENFASSTADVPKNPVEGMDWFNAEEQIPYFRDANAFVPYATGNNSTSVGFVMLPAATGVDFGTQQELAIFTAPDDGKSFLPMQVVLIPNEVVDVNTPANFSLKVSNFEDVAETATVVNAASNRHALFNIQGSTTFASGADSIYIEITQAGTGGTNFSMKYDVMLFGLIRTI